MLTKNNLHEYQKRIVAFIIKHPQAFIIAEMGLGKTVAALYAILYLQKTLYLKKVMIIAPLRVVYNSWPREIRKWAELEGLSYNILHGKDKNILPTPEKLLLTNYESLAHVEKYKLHKGYDILVIDESSFVKNHRTKRFKLLKKMTPAFKRVILLTGTPTPSGNLMELFSQTFLMDRGQRFGTSFQSFRARYYDQKDFMGYTYELKPNAKQAIEKKINDISLVLKSKDYIDLPPVVRNTVLVKMPPKAWAIYRSLEKEFIAMIQKKVVTVANSAVLSLKLRQVCAGHVYDNDGSDIFCHDEKTKALQEITEATDSNVLCSYQFKFERRKLTLAFPHAEFIDGGTSAQKSNELISSWEQGEIRLLCCHPASVGHGLNLQGGGNVLVWMSPDWSLERTQQMEARLYRQGQTKKVFIHTIACNKTIEIAVLSALCNKDISQKAFINALLTHYKENPI